MKVARKGSDDGNSRTREEFLDLIRRDLCIPVRHTMRRHLVLLLRPTGKDGLHGDCIRDSKSLEHLLDVLVA